MEMVGLIVSSIRPEMVWCQRLFLKGKVSFLHGLVLIFNQAAIHPVVGLLWLI
jgi:hypothetical protein